MKFSLPICHFEIDTILGITIYRQTICSALVSMIITGRLRLCQHHGPTFQEIHCHCDYPHHHCHHHNNWRRHQKCKSRKLSNISDFCQLRGEGAPQGGTPFPLRNLRKLFWKLRPWKHWKGRRGGGVIPLTEFFVTGIFERRPLQPQDILEILAQWQRKPEKWFRRKPDFPTEKKEWIFFNDPQWQPSWVFPRHNNILYSFSIIRKIIPQDLRSSVHRWSRSYQLWCPRSSPYRGLQWRTWNNISCNGWRKKTAKPTR